MLLKASVPTPRPSYLKSNSTVCLPGVSASGAFPLDALQVDHVPEEHRLALEQVEAVAGEAPARGEDHALRTALRNIDFRGDGVGGVEDGRRVTLRQTDHRAGVDELRAAGGDVRAWGD